MTDKFKDLPQPLQAMFGFCGLLIVGLFVTSAFGLFDAFQERRAFPALAECRRQGLATMRQSFTTTVVCVRQPGYRSDSLNVKVSQ